MDAASIATKRRDGSTVSFNVYLVEDQRGLLLESRVSGSDGEAGIAPKDLVSIVPLPLSRLVLIVCSWRNVQKNFYSCTTRFDHSSRVRVQRNRVT
jgi:hypothetical protein